MQYDPSEIPLPVFERTKICSTNNRHPEEAVLCFLYKTQILISFMASDMVRITRRSVHLGGTFKDDFDA